MEMKKFVIFNKMTKTARKNSKGDVIVIEGRYEDLLVYNVGFNVVMEYDEQRFGKGVVLDV